VNDTNYEVYRGDTFAEQLVFTETDANGVVTPTDITGWTIFFTIKKNKSDTDANATIKVTLADSDLPSPELGIATVVVTAAQLDALIGMYYYDFQMKTVDGKVYTILEGTITFIADITRRIVE